jgi:hypothetical protein
MIMNDDALNDFVEKDKKKPNRLADILFEDDM